MGSRMHQTAIGRHEEYLTPPYILAHLGEFDLDPCAPVSRPWPTAKAHYTIEDDGLAQEWAGRVWLNPPFTRGVREKWMKKMSEHGNGIMLLPCACETKAFSQYVWGVSSGILMLNHRPFFYKVDGNRHKSNSGGTICMVAYGDFNLQKLVASKLGPVLTEVKPCGPDNS